MCVHDGSYMPHLSTTACSAGFIIRCMATGKTATGSIAEQSDSASNYRGEILGGMMIQLVLRAASRDPDVAYHQIIVNCDNIGVVGHGNNPNEPLPEKQTQADTLRCLKQYIRENFFEVVYEWVAAHQDDDKSWDDLTLKEQLNVIVDSLAKRSLVSAVLNDDFISSLFPFEQVRVHLGGRKLTSSPKQAVDDFWGHRCAKQLYHTRGIIDRLNFRLVWWDGVDTVNKKVPKSFSVWLTKQTSHFAGTNRQLHRIDASVDNVCPSCGKGDESVKHITRCTDEGRQEMFRSSVADVVQWLVDKDTDGDLVAMIEEYLLAQDGKTMMECCDVRRYEMLARTHDKLGWDNFLEGRISVLLLEAYRMDADDEISPYTVQAWGRGLIEKLIRITHSQWIFRNSHVHYKKLEGMTKEQHLETFRRVEELMWEDPMTLLPRHRHLLEENLGELGECSTATRMYWILQVEAAKATADTVLAGDPVRDRYKAFIPTGGTRHKPTPQAKPRRNGSIVYGFRTRSG